MRPRSVAPIEIVEAARDCFVSLGVRQVTVEDVAHRAHVSRATVYRTVGARPDLVRAVLMDEAGELFANVAAALSVAQTPSALVSDGVAAALATVRARPVLRRFAGPDLEFVLPVLTVSATPIIAGGVQFLVPLLREAQGRGVLGGAVQAQFRLPGGLHVLAGEQERPTFCGYVDHLSSSSVVAPAAVGNSKR